MQEKRERTQVLKGDLEEREVAVYQPGIEFARIGTRPLTLELLRPGFLSERQTPRRHPLIVFVQGSAWTHPNPYHQLPQLSLFARAGYVVASVIHRASEEAAFPACLVDVKAAIRFLRANAGAYDIDPERVAIWGTSSGGNLALLAAATQGRGELEQGAYLTESSGVQAVVDFFGPAAMEAFMEQLGIRDVTEVDPGDVVPLLIGGLEGDVMARLRAVSPTSYLKPGMKLPPHLLAHGDDDQVVPFAQSALYAERLRALGAEVAFYRVAGAGHETGFWTPGVLGAVRAFLDRHLMEPGKK